MQAREQFAHELNALLDRSALSAAAVAAAAKRHGIGYSTVQSWRTGEHLPRVPDDNPPFLDFLREVAASPSDVAATVAAATRAWRESVRARKKRPTGRRSGFVGRAGHLAVLAGPHRLVVISGPGGIGKSALAQEVTRPAAHVLRVDLRGSTAEPLSTGAALTHLLASVASGLSGGVDVLSTTYQHLLASRRTTVVLDDAASAAQVVPLLPRAPECVTVVTSRAPLTELESRHGALRVDLGPLRPEESLELLGSALSADTAALAELAELCGHVPLRLRVAAGQLTAAGAPSVARYLATARGGTADQVQLAYRDLPEPARALFRRLGHIPGDDITAPAAAALAGVSTEEAVRQLDRLAAANLVEQRDGRFSLHDALRLVALDLADPGDAAAVTGLARYYAAGTTAAARLIFPESPRLIETCGEVAFACEREASAWLAAEQFNIIATASAAIGSQDELTWALADALRVYQQVRPHGMDWTPIAASALRAAQAKGDVVAKAAMYLAAGMASWGVGRLDQTVTHLAAAVALFRGMPRERAFALNVLGAAEYARGALKEARTHCAESLRLRRRFGELRGQSSTLVVLSGICADLGQLTRSAAYATEALELAERTGYTAGCAGALGTLGRVAVEQGRHAEAREYYAKQLGLSEDLAFRSRKAIALVGLADVSLKLRRYDEAIATATEAAAVAGTGGNLAAEVDALNVLGAAHLARGRFTEAVSRHRQALDSASVAGYLRGRAEALIGLSRACGGHDLTSAVCYAKDAVVLADESDLRMVRAAAHAALTAAEAAR